jgi:hypothetical protein
MDVSGFYRKLEPHVFTTKYFVDLNINNINVNKTFDESEQIQSVQSSAHGTARSATNSDSHQSLAWFDTHGIELVYGFTVTEALLDENMLLLTAISPSVFVRTAADASATSFPTAAVTAAARGSSVQLTVVYGQLCVGTGLFPVHLSGGPAPGWTIDCVVAPSFDAQPGASAIDRASRRLSIEVASTTFILHRFSTTVFSDCHSLSFHYFYIFRSISHCLSLKDYIYPTYKPKLRRTFLSVIAFEGDCFYSPLP